MNPAGVLDSRGSDGRRTASAAGMGAGWADLGWLALFFTALTGFLEVVCAYRDPRWTGVERVQIASALAVAAVLFLASLGIARLSQARGTRSVAIPPGLGVAGAHALYWLALRRGADPPELGITLGGLLAYGCSALVLARAPRGAAFGALLCVLSGLGAVLFAADRHYLDPPARQHWVTVAAVGWPLLSALPAWAARRLGPSSIARRGASALLLALLVAPPLAAAYRRLAADMQATSAGPHLLLVTCDTFRPDFTSAFGGATPTPRLERLLARSVTFARAYSVAPWTLPSFVGMFASRYSPNLPAGASLDEMHLTTNYFPVQSEVTTVAQQAFVAGYTTCGVSTNPWLNDQGTGLLRGFEHGTLIPNGIGVETWGPLALVPNLQRSLQRWLPVLCPERPNDSSPHALRFATEFLARHRSERVFLWVHLMDPHTPYDPPARYRTRDHRWPFFAPDIPAFEVPPMEDEHFIELDPEGEAQARDLYRGELRYFDDNLGALLDTFERLGLRENGYITVASDHGEELWEHGKVFHGQSLFEEQVRVVLAVGGPGIAPATIEAPVSTIDLAPTLADLLGLEADPRWIGRSLAAGLRGDDVSQPSPVFFNSTFVNAAEPLMGVVHGNWKLIQGIATQPYELYDLAADPGETSPLPPGSAGAAGVLEVLAARIAATFREYVRDLPLHSEEVARQVEELKALGYF